MKIVIKEEHHSGNCDDCGHFSDCLVTVTQDDVVIASICSDGHMGGGDFDDQSPASAIAAFLRKIHPDASVETEGPFAD